MSDLKWLLLIGGGAAAAWLLLRKKAVSEPGVAVVAQHIPIDQAIAMQKTGPSYPDTFDGVVSNTPCSSGSIVSATQVDTPACFKPPCDYRSWVAFCNPLTNLSKDVQTALQSLKCTKLQRPALDHGRPVCGPLARVAPINGFGYVGWQWT